MNCPSCVADIPDDAIACRDCGRDLFTSAPQDRTVSSGKTFGLVMGGLGLVVMLVVIESLTASRAPSDLLPRHRDAVANVLAARALSQPVQLSLSDVGFVTANYELSEAFIRELADPLPLFAEQRLLAIREALLPFGFENYTVNINGTPPGADFLQRYGASRLTADGSVEWVQP